VLPGGTVEDRQSRRDVGRTRRSKALPASEKQPVRIHGRLSKKDGSTEEVALNEPCSAPPGSEEKIQILEQRYAAGFQTLFLPGDATLEAWDDQSSNQYQSLVSVSRYDQ
jgi:hypothetical protein